jgi:hypothetical protein
MTVALARSASSAVSRRVAGRQMSTAKMHKAKTFWPEIKAKRPVDHDDEHVSFRPSSSRCTLSGFQIPTNTRLLFTLACPSSLSFTPLLTRLASLLALALLLQLDGAVWPTAFSINNANKASTNRVLASCRRCCANQLVQINGQNERRTRYGWWFVLNEIQFIPLIVV